MTRSVSEIEAELEHAETVVLYGGVAQHDHHGHEVMTAAEHAAAYARRADRLRAELVALRAVAERVEETR